MNQRERGTVLLTGATGMIGRALTSGLLEAGFDVVFTSRSAERVRDLEGRFRELSRGRGGRLWGLVVDLEDDDMLSRIESELTEREVFPDLLINNARNREYLEPSAGGTVSSASWQGEFRLGVEVPYRLSMFMASDERFRLRGIVNISSIYGMVAPNLGVFSEEEAAPAHYGTVKAALLHLTRELAVRLAPRGVRVNAVSYGGVRGRADTDFERRYGQLSPQGRMLELDEVAGPVLFLLSDGAAAAITGQNLPCEGGWTAW